MKVASEYTKDNQIGGNDKQTKEQTLRADSFLSTMKIPNKSMSEAQQIVDQMIQIGILEESNKKLRNEI
jgi:hypothetical protein